MVILFSCINIYIYIQILDAGKNAKTPCFRKISRGEVNSANRVIGLETELHYVYMT